MDTSKHPTHPNAKHSQLRTNMGENFETISANFESLKERLDGIEGRMRKLE